MASRIIAKHESEVPRLKTIGIVGGMGQWATLDIIKGILKAAVDYPIPQYGNRGYPAMNIRMVNKAPMVLNADGSYPDKLEPSETLLEAVKYVSKDSDFIIVASNTAHVFTAQIEQVAKKPLLSLIGVAVEEAKRRNCRKVGILSIGLTVRLELFQKPLQEAGIESVLLSDNLAKRLDDEGVYPVQEGGDPKEYSAIAHEAVAYLRTQDVDAIIFGCTEIPLLLDEQADEADIINPSELVTREAIRRLLL